MSTKSQQQRYRVDPHARFRVMDDEGIFILQEAGEVLVVNEVGAFIVEQLQAERSVDEVVMAITDRYAVDQDRARADARSLVDVLLEAGAISQT
ncbi:MAG: PqqD family protein [Polyangiales bacterium]